MLKKPMPRAKTILLLLTAVLLAGCALDDQTPAPPATEPPVSISRPPYILDVSPAENSAVSRRVYTEDNKNHEAGLRSPEDGFASSVCLDLELWPLVEKGDDFTDSTRVDERIELFVDRRPAELLPNEGMSGGVLGARRSPGSLTPEAHWVGPLARCWQAPLGVGTHEVVFRFRQTSGQVQEYSWSFTITRR